MNHGSVSVSARKPVALHDILFVSMTLKRILICGTSDLNWPPSHDGNYAMKNTEYLNLKIILICVYIYIRIYIYIDYIIRIYQTYLNLLNSSFQDEVSQSKPSSSTPRIQSHSYRALSRWPGHRRNDWTVATPWVSPLRTDALQSPSSKHWDLQRFCYWCYWFFKCCSYNLNHKSLIFRQTHVIDQLHCNND